MNASFFESFASPVGPLLIEAHESALVAVSSPGAVSSPRRGEAGRGAAPNAVTATAARALDRYFAGDLAALDALPCDPRGTPFQLSVWSELRKIPQGETISYTELARRVGRPRAVRAVGAANGRNPIALVIPCHRVIGASGELTGYAYGLAMKRWLLSHESALARAGC